MLIVYCCKSCGKRFYFLGIFAELFIYYMRIQESDYNKWFFKLDSGSHIDLVRKRAKCCEKPDITMYKFIGTE